PMPRLPQPLPPVRPTDDTAPLPPNVAAAVSSPLFAPITSPPPAAPPPVSDPAAGLFGPPTSAPTAQTLQMAPLPPDPAPVTVAPQMTMRVEPLPPPPKKAKASRRDAAPIAGGTPKIGRSRKEIALYAACAGLVIILIVLVATVAGKDSKPKS